MAAHGIERAGSLLVGEYGLRSPMRSGDRVDLDDLALAHGESHYGEWPSLDSDDHPGCAVHQSGSDTAWYGARLAGDGRRAADHNGGGGTPPVVVLCHMFLFKGVTLVAAGCNRWNQEPRDEGRGHYDGMGWLAGFGPDRQLHAE
jgi:hypothetical protein